jgi:serine/threonine protein kinase
MSGAPVTALAQRSVVLAAVGPVAAARWLGCDERVILATLVDRSERIVKIVHPEAVEKIQDLYRSLPAGAGLVTLLGGGVVGEFGYLVHPVYPRTLADLVARIPLPASEAADLLRPVAGAVELLHAAGWVHGDVKPANILVSAAGQAVLADLDDCVRTGTVADRVTQFYSPPEAIAGAAMTPEADYYGFAQTLGVVLGGESLVQASRVDPALAAIVDAIRLDTAATPGRRAVTPTELLGIARTVAPAPVSMLSTALSGLPSAGPAPDDDGGLAAAARAAFGDVDLRAATVERLSLRLTPPPERAEPDSVTSVWRTPAMLVALAMAGALIAAAITIVVVKTF